MKWTGERYLPFTDLKTSGVEIHYEHLHRYAFAAQFVKGKTVLDLASGEGYGSYMLSQEADYVLGVEIDQEAVEHARIKYPKDDLEFKQGSILEIPIAGEQVFDVAVCFEAIEHVSDQDKLLSEVKRLLKDDGLFIVSTPNKKIYTDGPNYHNPFHIKELYYSDFIDLLSNYFSDIYTFGQRIYAGSNIWRLSSKKVSDYSEFVVGREDIGFKFKSEPEKNPMYFIAIASNSNQGEGQNINSYFIDTSNALITLRDGNIAALTGQLHEVTSRVQTMERSVTEREIQLQRALNRAQAMEQAVAERDSQVESLTDQLREASNRALAIEQAVAERDSQIESLTGQLREASNRALVMEQAVAERDSQVESLTGQLREASNRALVMEQAVAERDSQVESLTGQFREASNRALVMEQAVAERDNQIVTMSDKINQADSLASTLGREVAEMHSSVIWQMTMRFHRGFVERALPHGTRMRGWYDFGLKGSRKFMNEGWSSYCDQYKRSRNTTKVKVDQELDTVKAVAIENERIIEKKVSVIIPTKNAGSDFEFTLEKIKNQKGVKDIEIIVVDSGSEDGTLKLAEKYGSRIYRIRPEEFNHGETRNFGARNANGDYILFMVQDAIPVGNYWLYDMVKVLKNDSKIAASTCRQIPRSDADLFACYSLWSHYNALDFKQDRITSIPDNFELLAAIEKRKVAGLEDTCCLVNRQIFNNYEFKPLKYAEDLDLGLRLLKDKYKLYFLYSVAVIHSHNRDPAYFLKRSYINDGVLKGLLSGCAAPTNDFQEIFCNIKFLYIVLVKSINSVSELQFDNYDIMLSKFKSEFKYNLKKEIIYFDDFIYGNSELDKLLSKLERSLDIVELKSNDVIEKWCFDFVDDLFRYLTVYGAKRYKFSEISESLYKLFAIIAGSSLSSSNLSNSTRKSKIALEMDRYLSEGV